LLYAYSTCLEARVPHRLKSIAGLPRKIVRQLALLCRDPEKFGGNVLQFVNPALFESRLLNIAMPPPLHVRVDPSLQAKPSLNALLPEISLGTMSGGPNTVINLIYRVAEHGIPVRLVATVRPLALDADGVRRHAADLIRSPHVSDVQLVSAAQSERPLAIGPHDIFLATHWSTAQQVKAVLPHLAVRQFFYLIQDFEPGFFEWSSNHALALETLELDYWPIFNESLLAEFCMTQQVGRFSEPGFAGRAIAFEPAVDTTVFHSEPGVARSRPKRLLFYARPRASRNMFGLGLMALRQAAVDATFAGWEFVAIGSPGSMPEFSLGGHTRLRLAPWLSYQNYAELLRTADILLCPMLSPHTSYPVLEMAACGGLAVTNTFATKTENALRQISDNIVAAPPSIEGLRAALLTAAAAVNRGRPRTASLRLPHRWDIALAPTAAHVAKIFHLLSTADVTECSKGDPIKQRTPATPQGQDRMSGEVLR
jgi:hypothetical protein